MGAGASAHSYNKIERRWNFANLNKYIRLQTENQKYYDSEKLNPKDNYNDCIITGLRTKWGIDLNYIKEKFGEKYIKHLNKESASFIKTEHLIRTENNIKISEKGIFISDAVMEKLIIV